MLFRSGKNRSDKRSEFYEVSSRNTKPIRRKNILNIKRNKLTHFHSQFDRVGEVESIPLRLKKRDAIKQIEVHENKFKSE